MKQSSTDSQAPARGLRWSIISTYRKEIMGLAAIFVMINHFVTDAVHADLPQNIIHNLYVFDAAWKIGGVELFMFLSGMGLCFSMKKKPKLGTFYRKRFERLTITYCIWGIIYWISRDLLVQNYGVRRCIYDFSMISFWTEGVRSFWFIAVIAVLYLIYPLLYRLYSVDNPRRKLWFPLSILAMMLLFSLCYHQFPDFFDNTEVGLLRAPLFMFGAYYGEKVYADERFSLWDKLLLLIAVALRAIAVVLYLQDNSMTQYVYSRLLFGLWSIPVLVFLAGLLSKLPLKRFMAFLRKVGGLSLELYITHVSIWNLLNACNRANSPRNFCFLIILAIISSLALQALADKVKLPQTLSLRKKTEKTTLPAEE